MEQKDIPDYVPGLIADAKHLMLKAGHTDWEINGVICGQNNMLERIKEAKHHVDELKKSFNKQTAIMQDAVTTSRRYWLGGASMGGNGDPYVLDRIFREMAKSLKELRSTTDFEDPKIKHLEENVRVLKDALKEIKADMMATSQILILCENALGRVEINTFEQ